MSFSHSKLRRAAEKQGFRLCRSRWRRESVDNYGGWQIVDAWNNTVVNGLRYDLTDDDVAEILGLMTPPTIVERASA